MASPTTTWDAYARAKLVNYGTASQGEKDECIGTCLIHVSRELSGTSIEWLRQLLDDPSRFSKLDTVVANSVMAHVSVNSDKSMI